MPTTDDRSAISNRQPFLLGANLPWVRYGCDFGVNRWNAGGLSRRPDHGGLRTILSDLAARGVTALRWFVFCDGRSGIDFDAGGAPVRLQPSVRDDFQCALAIASGAGLRLVPVLFDFTWCGPARVVDGVRLGGRTALWRSRALRDRLLELVIRPFAAEFAADERVLAWDLMNEPEWVTRGTGTWRPWRSLSVTGMRRFLDAVGRILRVEGARALTVGSASARWLWLVKPLGLDVYQPHWYDHLDASAPLAHPVAALDLDGPAWLGELPTHHSRHAPDRIFHIAHEAGYGGAFFWSAMAEDRYTDLGAATQALDRWAGRA